MGESASSLRSKREADYRKFKALADLWLNNQIAKCRSMENILENISKSPDFLQIYEPPLRISINRMRRQLPILINDAETLRKSVAELDVEAQGVADFKKQYEVLRKRIRLMEEFVIGISMLGRDASFNLTWFEKTLWAFLNFFIMIFVKTKQWFRRRKFRKIWRNR